MFIEDIGETERNCIWWHCKMLWQLSRGEDVTFEWIFEESA
jgi:hypothetical protein